MTRRKKIYAQFGTYKGRKRYYPWHNLAQKCAEERKFGKHWSPTPATNLWTVRWTHSRPTIEPKMLTRANAILARRWYRLPHTLPSLLMQNSRKVARPQPRQAPYYPAPLWMERQRWCPPSADVPEARFPTYSALKKIDAHHSSLAQETGISTLPSKAEDTAMCRSS